MNSIFILNRNGSTCGVGSGIQHIQLYTVELSEHCTRVRAARSHVVCCSSINYSCTIQVTGIILFVLFCLPRVTVTCTAVQLTCLSTKTNGTTQREASDTTGAECKRELCTGTTGLLVLI